MSHTMSAPTRCLDCTHFRLKAAGQMAEHGYGICALDDPRDGHYLAARHAACPRYAPAAPAIAAKRQAWYANRRPQSEQGNRQP